MAIPFISKEPKLEEYWREIILFGKNSACYKFALAKALLELKPEGGNVVPLEELAPVYSKHVAEHLLESDRQGTASSSEFLDACRKFNSEELSNDQLVDQTIRLGFVNVIDAFHVIGPQRKKVDKRFFIDERKESKGIRITDHFSELVTTIQGNNFPGEVESRWRLVETAWRIGVSPDLLSISYEKQTESLIIRESSRRRTSVTGCRESFSGYQKGRCFYCFLEFDLGGIWGLKPEVDHFLPLVLADHCPSLPLDKVWNLVLSCGDCNRGRGGKSDLIPNVTLLERLHTRNEYLIRSHHPLRDTLIRQTGDTEDLRREYLQKCYNKAREFRTGIWTPELKSSPCF